MDSGSYSDSLAVSEVRPVLRNVFRKAYKAWARLEIDGTERMLRHHPAQHAPATRLPWPLNLLQMHDVGIVHFKGDDMSNEKRFDKAHLDEAIEEFLLGSKPSDQILIKAEY